MKTFRTEHTLHTHSCEQRRRFQQQHDIRVQWGFQAYNAFVKDTIKARPKTYEEFSRSAYYTAFVKFGRYCHDINALNFIEYAGWLLKNSKKIDHWCSDQLYSQWLTQYLLKENHVDALTRSIATMIDYCQQRPEFINGHSDYFVCANKNIVCTHITQGKISAWAVYNSQSGQEFVNALSDDHANMVMPYLDPKVWIEKFQFSPQDREFAEKVMAQAGL